MARVAELVKEAGVPDGVFSLVHARRLINRCTLPNAYDDFFPKNLREKMS